MLPVARSFVVRCALLVYVGATGILVRQLCRAANAAPPPTTTVVPPVSCCSRKKSCDRSHSHWKQRHHRTAPHRTAPPPLPLPPATAVTNETNRTTNGNSAHKRTAAAGGPCHPRLQWRSTRPPATGGAQGQRRVVQSKTRPGKDSVDKSFEALDRPHHQSRLARAGSTETLTSLRWRCMKRRGPSVDGIQVTDACAT